VHLLHEMPSGGSSEVKQRLAAALTSLNTKLCDHAEGALVQVWSTEGVCACCLEPCGAV
jgi:hypothetical protein